MEFRKFMPPTCLNSSCRCRPSDHRNLPGRIKEKLGLRDATEFLQRAITWVHPRGGLKTGPESKRSSGILAL